MVTQNSSNLFTYLFLPKHCRRNSGRYRQDFDCKDADVSILSPTSLIQFVQKSYVRVQSNPNSMEKYYRGLLARRMRAIPVRNILSWWAVRGYESLRPRRENANAMHKWRAMELKIPGGHHNMCNDVYHEDTLAKIPISISDFQSTIELGPHQVPYQTPVERVDFIQCQP